jgi:spermidine synthase
MHFPFWKKWLSYLRPITLETASSPLNELLEVQLSNGRLMLCTENAVYSYSDLYDNFRDAFTALNIKALNIQEVLVLGLGLGSIPEMLEKNFDRNYYYTCIEADEEVIVLADKYVLKYLNSTMDVVYADAAEWVWVTEQQFDLLCVDIFVDDSTPSDFRELDFLEQCNELLAENGILIYNCLAYNSTDMENTQQFYDTVFQHAFAKTQILKLRCNWMLVGFK